MTFSIVAVDQERKEVGFAIASCFWNAGQVGLARFETGAIVSQAQGNWDLIPVFFEKLGDGMSPQEILEHFRKIDENIEKRQIGMVSFKGDALAFSGEKVERAFQKMGKGYACQGNIIVGEEIIDSMAAAFENSEGPLAERLYAALQAGDDAGGDMRGKISARVYVERDRNNSLINVTTDFTVGEHQEPVREIGRLLNLRKSLVAAWELTQKASAAEGPAKHAAVTALDEFLKDKQDRLYLDFLSDLGALYLELGNRMRAIEIFKTVVRISPRMISTFEEDLRREVQ